MKFLPTVMVLFVGALIITMIDVAMGVNFTGVSIAAQTIHKTVYICWGAFVAWLVMKMKSR